MHFQKEVKKKRYSFKLFRNKFLLGLNNKIVCKHVLHIVSTFKMHFQVKNYSFERIIQNYIHYTWITISTRFFISINIMLFLWFSSKLLMYCFCPRSLVLIVSKLTYRSEMGPKKCLTNQWDCINWDTKSVVINLVFNFSFPHVCVLSVNVCLDFSFWRNWKFIFHFLCFSLSSSASPPPRDFVIYFVFTFLAYKSILLPTKPC